MSDIFKGIPELIARPGEAAGGHVAGWLSEKPSRALVACNERGHGAVVAWVGADLYLEICEAGLSDLGDLGLDDAPFGLSIWEGRYMTYRTGNPLDGEDYDTEAKGAFRDLTDEEWAAVRGRRVPWDRDEWLIPDARGEGKVEG